MSSGMTGCFTPATSISFRNSGATRSFDHGRAASNKDSIITMQGNYVRDGAQCDEVKHRFKIEIDASSF